MKILQNCIVTNTIELLYVKTMFKNLQKNYPSRDPAFLEFGIMELGNNLLKHTSGGQIWLVLSNQKLGIVSVDNGPGIENVELARIHGHSSLNNSLGLGLFSLGENTDYRFDIISFSPKNSEKLSGTVLTLLETVPEKHSSTLLSMSLYDTPYNGDFLVEKGRFSFFADVSGHGKKAHNSAQKMIAFFKEKAISCLTIKNFFKDLHDHLIDTAQRSLVGCIIETTQTAWTVCGVGNIAILSEEEDSFTRHSLPDGIIGEAFNRVGIHKFSRDTTTRLIFMSDGIDSRKIRLVLEKAKHLSNETLAVALNHFAANHDDKTVLILS